MEVKEYYEQISSGRDYIRDLETHIRISRESLPDISSKPFDLDFTTGSKNLKSPQEIEITRIIELEEHLQEYKSRYQDLLIEADILLCKVKNFKIQSVLRYFYIHGKSRIWVKDFFDRDERTIRRWFNEGFEQIVLPAKAINLHELERR